MTTEDDPAALFTKIREKALSMGITPDQLEALESVQNLKAPRWKWLKHTRKVLSYLTVVIVVMGVILAVDWPVSRRTLAEYYFEFFDSDIERDTCLVNMQEILLDVTRPPMDCAMCRNVKRIEKVSKITPEEFEAKYAYTGRPVVIVDAMENWTASEVFSFRFFRDIYSDDSPVMSNMESNCQFFPYKTDFRSLGEVFNMSAERAQLRDGAEPWYIGWSNCDSSAANILRQHYEKPYFLPTVAESSKTDWIFMGSPGYGAHMHVDNVGNPSWQAQVSGVKRWILEPPPECYSECVNSLDIIIQPGEIIVLDTNRWFHATKVEGTELSIVIGSEYD